MDNSCNMVKYYTNLLEKEHNELKKLHFMNLKCCDLKLNNCYHIINDIHKVKSEIIRLDKMLTENKNKCELKQFIVDTYDYQHKLHKT